MSEKSYVQEVPEHCDRIIWRGRYYHLASLDNHERLRAAQTQAVHAAITRALDEAGVRPEVLRGMCIEVGLEAYRASLSASGSPQSKNENDG